MATRVKRYESEAVRLDELLARIQSEMGPGAIVQTREFRRGAFLGLIGGTRMVEAIATLELDAPGSGNGHTTHRVAPEVELTPVVDDVLAAQVNRASNGQLQHSLWAADAPAEPVLPEPGQEIEDVPRVPQAAAADEVNALRSAVDNLQATVQQLVESQQAVVQAAAQAANDAAQAALRQPVEQTGPATPLADPVPRTAASSVANPVELDPATSLTAVQRQVYDTLLDWNISHYDALELLNTALAAQAPGTAATAEGLMQAVSDDICRNVLLGEGIRLNRNPPGKTVALIGPTGVGKTTTIAKLAAVFAFQQNKRVSLVSLDNYRIAAVEQLRTYSEIMGLNLDVVFSQDEFDNIISKRRSSHLVLIDTAGRSPNSAKQIAELREVFKSHPPDEVHLVIPAGVRRDDLKLILESFKPLDYDHIIVSKLDETRNLGALFNLTKSCGLPISYFTTGQNVPEDIRTATLPFIIQWITQGRVL